MTVSIDPAYAIWLIGLLAMNLLATCSMLVVLTWRRAVGHDARVIIERIEALRASGAKDVEGMRCQLDSLYTDQEQAHRFMRTDLTKLSTIFKNWCK